jgi:hypothetical protein
MEFGYGEMKGNLMMKEKMRTWHSYGQVGVKNWLNIFTIAQGEINIQGRRGSLNLDYQL